MFNRLLILFSIFFLSFHLVFAQVQNLPSYEYFIGRLIQNNVQYMPFSNEINSVLINSEELKKIYLEGMQSFTQAELASIYLNPNNILSYTRNESVILMTGVNLAVCEVIKAQSEINSLVFNRLKNRISFILSSGDNYGMIVPLRFPLVSVSLGLYSDLPNKIDSSYYEEKQKYYDYAALAYAIDSVPLPYAQITGQVNLWTLPISIGFRGGYLLGLPALYKKFVADVDIKSEGFHIGADIKASVWRNNYFFIDFRTDLNFDKGSLNASLKRDLYVPVGIGYLGGVDTGIIFNSNPAIEAYWQAFAITPKFTIGFKPKERIPIIRYFGLSFSIGYDIHFMDTSSSSSIEASSAWANIVGSSQIVDGLIFPDFSEKSDFFGQEIRLTATMDIFYMSFSFEYGVFSKRYSFLFTPLLLRF